MVIKNWKMDFMENKGLSCSAPCDMYSVLLEHGIINDPYYGANEDILTELSRYDSAFYSEISLNDEQLMSERIELKFLGLDTICDIYFNGTHLDSVMNMHRMYEYDVKHLAKAKNEIRLEFKAPIPYFEKMESAHHLYTSGDTIQGASHLRKALYMSGWDWAPMLPNMGIFRDVELNCYNGDRLEDVSITQHHENGRVRLSVSASTKHGLDGYDIYARVEDKSILLENGTGEIIIENPRLWWPNGYGKQELYDVDISLCKGNTVVDKSRKTIGLRTLTLSQEDDQYGKEFCFKVNGVKIFAMGANYVPMDNLIARDTNERLERLIKDCIFANFNCIRVWGGAYYPCDHFYDLCDRYGLIVWQDFMVACANVWLTEKMEEEFISEAIYNVKRIRHHASLGILCGNNEMEEAICNWDCADGHDPEVRRDYLRLYEDILPRICKEHAPYISYTPSSPTSGGGFDSPQDFTRGDVHFWNVWNGNCEFDEYRKHKFRFCSEYGFESLPSIKTIDAFCPKEERNLLSYTMERHQKHWHGNVKILRYLAERYQLPKDLETTVYASQLNQAAAIKYGVEHFRRNRGYTMGSIYWQLNDPWPVASWSSIDYYGRYKALHYFARKFYQPVSLGLFNDGDIITINVANESMEQFDGYVKFGVMKNDFTPISLGDVSVFVDKLSSKDVKELSNKDFNGSKDTYFFAELYSSDGTLLARNTELGCVPKYFKLLKPSIKVDATRVENGVKLSFSADVFTHNVQVSFENHDIQLSDNYFDLINREPYSIIAKTELSADELLNDISLLSVYDIPLKY
ncbi:MAG: glycoside hydrolase family 2 protein [Clostridia bacterium]|nr:glycoside hydrolase family 2 protein [Clostridia bacterium]